LVFFNHTTNLVSFLPFQTKNTQSLAHCHIPLIVPDMVLIDEPMKHLTIRRFDIIFYLLYFLR
jgi:hypothetical protein